MTKRTLVIGNRNYSSWSLRAWLALAHAGLPYDEIRIPLNCDDTDEKLRRYSPSLTVPVLIEDGVTIWDSLAICERLAEQAPGLWPADPSARAQARSVAAEMHSSFSTLRARMPMNIRATGRNVDMTPELERNIWRILEIWRECREPFTSVHPWLFGEFSIADAMFAPVAARFRTYGVRGNAIAEKYIATLFADEHMRAWETAARAEKEIIDVDEVGIT